MSHMDATNRIMLSTKNIVESSRDSIIKNVIQARRELEISDSSLKKLISLVKITSDDVLFKALSVHEKEVKSALKDSAPQKKVK